ncbi:MAG: aminoglycoside phosphotransferase family protein [Solirubrobacterales bacterium]
MKDAPLTADRPSDAELRAALGRVFGEVGAAAPEKVSRRPSDYRTSFPLEELEVTLADGTRLHLAFKRLDWGALGEEARLAKPRFLHDPAREPAVYEAVLAPAHLGSRYYGSLVDPESERHWLFVEWVEGRELYQVGERALWEEAARWLGGMHSRLAGDLDRQAAAAHLLSFDESYYRAWIERARDFSRGPGRPPSLADAVDQLVTRYETALDELLALPKTVIHGEFYASNVLVGSGPDPRVCPIDWELAAVAPGLVDLAALISGEWSEEDRGALVSAYRSAPGVAPFTDRQLDLVRLHLAIQWLGWTESSWVPPEGQRHDWLREALALAEGLGL